MIWDEILFPFDPALRQRFDLAKLEVVRWIGRRRKRWKKSMSAIQAALSP
jgi:hypothetical protein